ncbi:putative Membrane-associated tyrosine- and threonine-specific cdc2-inhibitory kinase [Blattamonas nauphoetae]|uniref:Membrane-associated tyrosine- and threonine-specific cdc2-inhibitory kinase n=1 Tax=Blattamonas nauphoetae TaxID=2049346 RepID=A0ABQ9XKN9_9EUKA|nr:putative Membrane-associated tyrosine- and threonine-specific cdc2-inhibitory kinase [Blattamonas nauphoetae]
MSEPHPKPKAKKRFEVKVPDPYMFVRTLGQGRFGSVHEVSKTPTDEHFAMKILTFSSEADYKKNEHEISKLSKNQHRNVVRFVQAIEGDLAHFVVLELCSHSLQDELSEHKKLGGKMDVVRVYGVMRDVLNGIAYLHLRGEIYGDLKGSNVLIGKDGVAKLGDFGGVVGAGTMKTSNPAESGTMQFWAPELFKKADGAESSVGSRAGDMWAFGQLLLEMLTGRSWIVGESAVDIQQSVLEFDIGKICEREGIVGEVQVLLSLLLSETPSKRMSSVELVRSNRLQSILGPETPLSRFFAAQLEAANNELKSTRQQLLQQQSPTVSSPDNSRIQSLETELLAAQEEIRRLKESARTQRDESSSAQTTTFTQASFDFTDPSHFRVDNNIITRTDAGKNEDGNTRYSSVFLTDVLETGVISVEITLHSQNNGDLYFGLIDSNRPIPEIGYRVGCYLDNSAGLSYYGYLWSSSHSSKECFPYLSQGDSIRMEVDLNSTPRTLQFFVNEKAGKYFMSGIPSSVRIGFSIQHENSSIRIDNLLRLPRPTPTSMRMKKLKW